MPWSTCSPFHFFSAFWSYKLIYVPVIILWLKLLDLSYMQKRIPWSYIPIRENAD